MLFERYDKYWKFWLWIPIAILIISLGLLAMNFLATGDFVRRDVELTGGKMISAEVGDIKIEDVESAFPFAKVKFTSGRIIILEIPFEEDENDVLARLAEMTEIRGEPTIRTVDPALGEIFFQQTQIALITAFVIMSVVVFLLFRTFVPSSLVIFAALTDMIAALAISNAIGIKLSLPVIVALLTLIGYSVDTDILLTSNLLKSPEEDIPKKIKKAMKTGLTLTTTAIVALFALYVVTSSFVLEQIAIVLIIGLIIDIPSTWMTNAGLLRFYLQRKAKRYENA